MFPLNISIFRLRFFLFISPISSIRVYNFGIFFLQNQVRIFKRTTLFWSSTNNTPQRHFGRVGKVYPRPRTGLFRFADAKTSAGLDNLPVSKLCLMELVAWPRLFGAGRWRVSDWPRRFQLCFVLTVFSLRMAVMSPLTQYLVALWSWTYQVPFNLRSWLLSTNLDNKIGNRIQILYFNQHLEDNDHH